MWRVLFTLMVIGLCGKATAETGLLTLQQAVASALERNPQRKAALAEVRSAQASIKEARSEYFPRLGFTESVVRSNDPVFVFGARLRQNRFTAADFTLDRLNTPAPLDNFATRFGLHWKVFDSFVTESSVRQAVREKAASEQQLARTDQLIVFQVIQAYYGVLFASRQIEVAEHAVATSQSLLQQSRARFEAGSTVESDYLAAQVDYASRQQELVRARNVLALARAQLNIAMGMDPDREYTTVEPASPQDFQPPSLTEAEARALQERPDLKQSSEQVAAREAGVRSAKSAFGPRVNLFAASELDSANVFGNSGSNWTAGAELQFEIFSGGQKSARLSRTRANLEQARAMQQVAVDSVRLDVRRAWYDFDSARKIVEVNRTAAAQAEEASRIVANRYQAGMTTITEMLRAEDAARTARTNYWEALYRCGTGYAALELAMGTLGQQSQVVMP